MSRPRPSADALRTRLAVGQGRHDTAPDIALGRELARRRDAASIDALVSLLADRTAASSAIKALYECGYLAPGLLVPHADALFGLLGSRRNRLVWGGAIALSCVATADPSAVWPRRQELLALFDGGSVITRDFVVRTMALVAASSAGRRRELTPFLLRALETVRPVNLPRWAEDILPALSGAPLAQACALLEARLPELSSSSRARAKKLLKATDHTRRRS
jgi:hypothetical protein